jgi:hypothetical protein
VICSTLGAEAFGFSRNEAVRFDIFFLGRLADFIVSRRTLSNPLINLNCLPF